MIIMINITINNLISRKLKLIGINIDNKLKFAHALK